MLSSPRIPRAVDAGPTRRRLLCAASLAAATGTVGSADALLPMAEALQDHLAQALRQGDPLVVMASLAGCPFCHVARQNYLVPSMREQKLVIVQVDLNSPLPLRDFDGRLTTHGQQIRAWGIRIAPTVLFFGRGGKEATKRLVGASLPDFYGAYLDQGIEAARKNLG